VIKFLYERMSLRWILEHQIVFLKALLFVITDMSGEVGYLLQDVVCRGYIDCLLNDYSNTLFGQNRFIIILYVKLYSLLGVIHQSRPSKN